MKKLILLLLFIPILSFGQDTIPMTKILTQKEAYMNKMLELKKDYNTKDRYASYNVIEFINFLTQLYKKVKS